MSSIAHFDETAMTSVVKNNVDDSSTSTFPRADISSPENTISNTQNSASLDGCSANIEPNAGVSPSDSAYEVAKRDLLKDSTHDSATASASSLIERPQTELLSKVESNMLGKGTSPDTSISNIVNTVPISSEAMPFIKVNSHVTTQHNHPNTGANNSASASTAQNNFTSAVFNKEEIFTEGKQKSNTAHSLCTENNLTASENPNCATNTDTNTSTSTSTSNVTNTNTRTNFSTSNTTDISQMEKGDDLTSSLQDSNVARSSMNPSSDIHFTVGSDVAPLPPIASEDYADDKKNFNSNGDNGFTKKINGKVVSHKAAKSDVVVGVTTTNSALDNFETPQHSASVRFALDESEERKSSGQNTRISTSTRPRRTKPVDLRTPTMAANNGKDSSNSASRRNTPSSSIKKIGHRDTYENHDLVWAKNPGDPYWPAMIVTFEELPTQVAEYLVEKYDEGYYVFFFAESNFSRLCPKSLLPFHEYFDRHKDGCVRKQFMKAVEIITTNPIGALNDARSRRRKSVSRRSSARDTDTIDSDEVEGEISASDYEQETAIAKTPSRLSVKKVGAQKKIEAAMTDSFSSSVSRKKISPESLKKISNTTTPRQVKLAAELLQNSRSKKASATPKSLGKKRVVDEPLEEDNSYANVTNKKQRRSSKNKINVDTAKIPRSRDSNMIGGTAVSGYDPGFQNEFTNEDLNTAVRERMRDTMRVARFILQSHFIKDKNYQSLPRVEAVPNDISWTTIRHSLTSLTGIIRSRDVDFSLLVDNRIPRVLKKIRVSCYSEEVERQMAEHGIREMINSLISEITVMFGVSDFSDTNAAVEGGTDAYSGVTERAVENHGESN